MNSVDELNLLLGIGPARPQLPVTLRKSGYIPVRALGKGSYGQALLVFHEPRQQYFVVKHLNLAGMSSRQRHDAHNEISILQKLHHPNIIQYVEYYEEHPNLYIVMEYADGGDVYSLLSKAQAARKAAARANKKLGDAAAASAGGGSAVAAANESSGLLSEVQVVSLFVQTTMAVKYMHDRRLLHRDIKSSNIFLTKNHVVKLGDFGISTVLQSTMAMASTMCGTPCYFSPELCQGRPYNNKSDMWALGVLLYELCAGQVPFESTTMRALMRDIVHRQPPRIPALYSDSLWELIVQLLQKDPRRRPDAGQVLMSATLMKYIPELMEQLASDPAYAAAAANDEVQNNNEETSNKAADHYSDGTSGFTPATSPAAPPPPPPRRVPQKNAAADALPVAPPLLPAAGPSRKKPLSPLPLPPAAAAGNPALKGTNAVGPNQNSRAGGPSPSSTPPRPHEGPPATPPPSSKQQPPPSSTASIAALLARFDAQKQELAASKLKKKEEQNSQPRQPPDAPPPSRPQDDANSSGNGSNLPGLRNKKRDHHFQAPPSSQQQQQRRKEGEGAASAARLSPGAAAALRQQGLDPESDSQVFPLRGPGGHPAHAGSAAAAAGHRRSFAPPPLPAALRGTSATNIKQHEDHGDAPHAAAAVGSGNNAERAVDSPHGGGSSSAAAAGVAAPTGSAELGAVLTELSTWRERSLRRQHRSQRKGEPVHPNQAKENRSSSKAAEEKREGAAPSSSSPQPQRHPSSSQEKDGLSAVNAADAHPGEVTAGAAKAAATKQSADVASRATPSPSKGTATEAQRANALHPATGLLPSLPASPPPQGQHQQLPQPGFHKKEGESPASAAAPKSVARSSSPAASPLAASSHGSAHTPSDEDDRANSNAQSFVDAMGTTLDVQALQEASSTSSSAAAGVPHANVSGTSSRHGHQQSMHKSYRGTSEKIGALRATLKADFAPHPTTAAAAGQKELQPNGRCAFLEDTDETPVASKATLPSKPEEQPKAEAAAEGGAGDDEEVVDMDFTTACLCGRATTSGGRLSMIYGSFICTCDVCVRFTGAARGVEWLHLPEIEALHALLKRSATVLSGPSPPTPLPSSSSPASVMGRPSAGAGATAAAAFRAHAAHSPPSPPSGAHKTELPARGSSPNTASSGPSPVSSSPHELLRQAGIRFYTHQQSSSSSVEDRDDVDCTRTKGAQVNGSTAIESYTLYTCATCGGMVSMLHDGVPGVLLPKSTLDEQSLQILSSCAQTVVDDEEEEG
ncbi:putative protein kinase [Leptomonas pyrrhocoris]|uniref:non-specific serine/threonine protein kinase n=1 Tax=Leptomonas pyrrhocoris TaxID=157538 RepID=A0A0M9FRS1_LEPPY|nr:putative protein kinase [Leptomonas pyrrhocoris]KPA74677.1 putative protein kinase [Leptomonas pyrrhocoris]|eukprot:XP_015653116.1 putative protein kinase [Leptomonas pyrrhocoris]